MRPREIPFAKLEGCGNDYIYVVLEDLAPDDAQWLREAAPELAVPLSDRHFGIGSDGLVLVDRDPNADGRMIMYNADGSRSETCGNALRCIGKILGERRDLDCRALSVATDCNTTKLVLHREVSDGHSSRVTRVSVDMGPARLALSDIPFLAEKATVLREPDEGRGEPAQVSVQVAAPGFGDVVRASVVSMGNPHAVIFLGDPENATLTRALETDPVLDVVGRAIETAPCFPRGTNVEFVARETDGKLFQRTWERGSGETLACGSGACAVAVAAAARGLAADKDAISVRLRGGELLLAVGPSVTMAGPVRHVFDGRFRVGADAKTCYDAFVQPPGMRSP